MDNDQKKIKYQELFLTGLRNSHFGEKRIEDALKEMETKPNMEKLLNALQGIWKKADENIKNLEMAFPVAEQKEPVSDSQMIPIKSRFSERKMDKKRPEIKDLSNLKVVSYDELLKLIDNLSTEEVNQILAAVADEEKTDHQYLTKLAEKLSKDQDSKKVPDSKPE